MKIGFANGSKPQLPITVAQAVEGTLTYYSGEGSIERTREIADNAATAIGKIVEALHAKGVLTDGEVFEMIGYPFRVLE